MLLLKIKNYINPSLIKKPYTACYHALLGFYFYMFRINKVRKIISSLRFY